MFGRHFAIITFLTCIFPPWINTLPSKLTTPLGYSPIFNPPEAQYRDGLAIDITRMALQLFATLVACGIVFIANPSLSLSKTQFAVMRLRLKTTPPRIAAILGGLIFLISMTYVPCVMVRHEIPRNEADLNISQTRIYAGHYWIFSRTDWKTHPYYQSSYKPDAVVTGQQSPTGRTDLSFMDENNGAKKNDPIPKAVSADEVFGVQRLVLRRVDISIEIDKGMLIIQVLATFCGTAAIAIYLKG